MTLPADQPITIVYHGKCIDGAACAWCVAKAHKVEMADNPNVTYIPYEHHDVETAQRAIRAAVKEGSLVYFVDVAPEPKFLDELMAPAQGKPVAQRIRIMDHHESAAKMLDGYTPPPTGGRAPKLDIVIEQKRASAARLVWERLLPGQGPPPVLNVINMMDGDAKALTSPHDFAAAAMVDTRDISTPDRAFRALRGLARLTFNQMAQAGRGMVVDQNVKIDKALENATSIPLQVLPGQPPVPVVIVNADVKQFGRQITPRLVKLGRQAGSGVALAWYMQQNGTVTMSIRTDGKPDASEIAAHLRTTMGVTGGGHEGAGAVHFASLFDFARHMPLGNAAAPAAENAASPARKDASGGQQAKP